MTSTLDKILDTIGDVRKTNASQTMAHVDVINRIEMNRRQQHNFDRLDAQVDAKLKQISECYEPPEKPDIDYEEEGVGHHINSPTINIGVEAAAALAQSLDKEEGSDDVGLAASAKTKKPGMFSKVPDWMKAAALVAAGAGGVIAYDKLNPDTNLDTDTRNIFNLEAVPFDPTAP